MKLIPKPKSIIQKDGIFLHRYLHIVTPVADERILKALEKFPLSKDGAPIEIVFGHDNSEAYTLEITQNKIYLNAEGAAGAFYGIQTLRQLFTYNQIPCLYIEDQPDFSYRGFYHDITRGRVPTVQTVKHLIDQMAYYKMNSLQLYVEHTFAFAQLKDTAQKTGYLTAEEIKEIDDYCYENFIEFIPSIATFGHLYELLQRPEYKEFCMLEEYQPEYHKWVERMRHHTIDPLNPQSFSLIQSMIDQYLPLFRSRKFNICGDETFDLSEGRHKGKDAGKLYVDFVQRIVRYLQEKGKTVMMWADILLKHPESIHELPEGIQYLNWWYGTNINEAAMEVFEKAGKTQIVCPGTQSWATFCPDITNAEINICRMAEKGYIHGAIGILNTNWGDYGHPCTLQMCMYPMVLGAAKSWSANTALDGSWIESVNHLLFHSEDGLQMLRWLGSLQIHETWSTLTCWYSNQQHVKKLPVPIPEEAVLTKHQRGLQDFLSVLNRQKWGNDRIKEEMILAAEGFLLITEQFAKIAGYPIGESVNIQVWLEKYKRLWRQESKESELGEINALFLHLETVNC